MKPMKLTDVGTDVELYLSDSEWVMQQKFDGARMLTTADLVERDGRIEYVFQHLNGSGAPMSFSAAKLKLSELEMRLGELLWERRFDHVVLDGELIIDSGVFHVFDVLEAREQPDSGEEPTEHLVGGEIWFHRHQVLKDVIGEGNELVQITPTAWTERAKTEMWEAVNKAGVEGAISKRTGSLYVPGTRTKDWVKHKLVKTAEVVIGDHSRKFDQKGMVTHGSAELLVQIDPLEDPRPWINAKGVRRPSLPVSRDSDGAVLGPKGYEFSARRWLPVGNASLIGKDLTITAGDVVEVNYLYWTGEAVIQPRIMRKRTDKEPQECTLEQFPAYTREVAWRDLGHVDPDTEIEARS